MAHRLSTMILCRYVWRFESVFWARRLVSVLAADKLSTYHIIIKRLVPSGKYQNPWTNSDIRCLENTKKVYLFATISYLTSIIQYLDGQRNLSNYQLKYRNETCQYNWLVKSRYDLAFIMNKICLSYVFFYFHIKCREPS